MSIFAIVLIFYAFVQPSSNTPSKHSILPKTVCNITTTDCGVHVCSYINSILGFPRMPASAVTTYSHLAAALFLREKRDEGWQTLLIPSSLQLMPKQYQELTM